MDLRLGADHHRRGPWIPGIYLYGAPLLNSLFGTKFSTTAPNTILGFTLVLLALQTIFNIVGVRLLGLISKIGTYVEIIGTFGIAILLAIVGFHHGFGFTFSTQVPSTPARTRRA